MALAWGERSVVPPVFVPVPAEAFVLGAGAGAAHERSLIGACYDHLTLGGGGRSVGRSEGALAKSLPPWCGGEGCSSGCRDSVRASTFRSSFVDDKVDFASETGKAGSGECLRERGISTRLSRRIRIRHRESSSPVGSGSKACSSISPDPEVDEDACAWDRSNEMRR